MIVSDEFDTYIQSEMIVYNAGAHIAGNATDIVDCSKSDACTSW